MDGSRLEYERSRTKAENSRAGKTNESGAEWAESDWETNAVGKAAACEMEAEMEADGKTGGDTGEDCKTGTETRVDSNTSAEVEACVEALTDCKTGIEAISECNWTGIEAISECKTGIDAVEMNNGCKAIEMGDGCCALGSKADGAGEEVCRAGAGCREGVGCVAITISCGQGRGWEAGCREELEEDEWGSLSSMIVISKSEDGIVIFRFFFFFFSEELPSSNRHLEVWVISMDGFAPECSVSYRKWLMEIKWE